MPNESGGRFTGWELEFLETVVGSVRVSRCLPWVEEQRKPTHRIFSGDGGLRAVTATETVQGRV